MIMCEWHTDCINPPIRKIRLPYKTIYVCKEGFAEAREMGLIRTPQTRVVASTTMGPTQDEIDSLNLTASERRELNSMPVAEMNEVLRILLEVKARKKHERMR